MLDTKLFTAVRSIPYRSERGEVRLQSSATLSALIEQRGLNQSRLAAAAGCSKSFVNSLCLGQRQTCSDELAERIAEVLRVPLDVLFAPTESHAAGCTVPNCGVA